MPKEPMTCSVHALGREEVTGPLGLASRLLKGLRLLGGQHLGVVALQRRGDGGLEQLVVAFAHPLGAGAAQRAGARGVDHQVAALQVLHEDGVGGAFDDGVEQRVALDERALGPFARGDVLHHAVHARGLAVVGPHHLAAAVNDALVAVRVHDGVLDVVGGPSGERGGGGFTGSRAVQRVDQREPLLVPLREVDGALFGREAEDAARLVRERDAAGHQVAVPVADVGDALGVVEPSLTLSEPAQHQHARQRVGEATTNLFEQAPLAGAPGRCLGALVQAEQVRLGVLREQRHHELRANLKARRELGHRVVLSRPEREGPTSGERPAEDGRRLRVDGQREALGEGAGEVLLRALHHHAPRRRGRVAGKGQPRTVAAEELERRLQHRARHALEVCGARHAAIDAVEPLEEPDVVTAQRLSPEAFVPFMEESALLVSRQRAQHREGVEVTHPVDASVPNRIPARATFPWET